MTSPRRYLALIATAHLSIIDGMMESNDDDVILMSVKSKLKPKVFIFFRVHEMDRLLSLIVHANRLFVDVLQWTFSCDLN